MVVVVVVVADDADVDVAVLRTALALAAAVTTFVVFVPGSTTLAATRALVTRLGGERGPGIVEFSVFVFFELIARG